MNNNGKKLLDKLSELDPELITNADKKPIKKSGMILGFTSGMAAVAAATIIAVAANHAPERVPPVVDTSTPVSSSSRTGTSDTNSSTASTAQEPVSKPTGINEPADPPQLDFSKYKDLPKISDANYSVSGMGGYGGEISTWGLYSWQFEDNSPWNGEALETMPVYMSRSTEEPDLDKMYARVKEVAALLGISEDELEITDTYYNVTGILEKHREWGAEKGLSEEEIEEMINGMFRSTMSMVQVTGKADGVEIRLDTAYRVCIDFDEPIELPEGFKFMPDATDKEKTEVLDWLAESYKELTGYGKSAVKSELDVGNRGYIFKAEGDLTEQVVNYSLNTTTFLFDFNSGKTFDTIWIYTDDALEKIADYPVLTAEQALAILKSNRYDEYVRMSADAKILKTELYYSNPAGATAVMPYYRFFIESDHDLFPEYDIKCDVYTIAAVPEEFIDMDTKDYGARA